MNKKCGKCEKTVYPTEELKCLDKVWHKGCFRCWDCGMSLTMKNYKGYDKKPYCNAHYPTTKFTSVADTPEMNRLAQNTKNQSLLKYHESFEASKGKCMSVADDPETKRHMENTAKISAVEYHKEFEKNQKGHKIQVADDPETQRIRANSAVISNVEYTKGYKHQKPQMAPPPGYGQSYGQKVPMGGYGTDQQAETFSPYSDKNQGHSVRYESNGAKEEALLRQQPGSIHDFDPANDKWGSIGQGYRPNSGGGRQDWEETVPVPTQPQYNPQPSQPPPQVHPGPAIPINQPLALHVRHPDEEPGRQRGYQEDPRQMAYQEPPRQRAYQEPPQQPPYQEPPRSQPAYHEPPPPQQPQPAPPAPKSSAVADAIYQAMYDYEAQDDDEVGFQDGDLIDNIEPIDDGWMFGTVRRSGMRGMLPANYVERVQ